MKKPTMKPFLMGLLILLTLAFILAGCGSSDSGNNSNPPPSGNHIVSFGNTPRFSPDGSKIAFGGDQSHQGIWVYTLSSGDYSQIVDSEHPHLYDYRWSPNGDRIAFGGAGAAIDSTAGIYVVALDGSMPLRWNSTGKSPSWLPDESGLVFEENNTQANLFGIFKLTFADTLLQSLASTGIEPQVSPQGDLVAYRNPGTFQYVPLRVVPVAGGASIAVADTCLHFCWTATGGYLVFDYVASGERQISKVSSAGGDPVDIVFNASYPSVAANNIIAYAKTNQDLSAGINTITLSGAGDKSIASDGSQPDINSAGTKVVYVRNDGLWLVNL